MLLFYSQGMIQEYDSYTHFLFSENRQMEDSMPIPSYLELLQESIRIQRESEAPSRDGPPSDRHAGRWGKRRRAAELWKSKSEKEEDKPAPVDGELWTFLIGHIGPILSGKGHNDQQPVNNRRGKPTPQTGSHFESISCQTLFNTADLLYRFLFLDKLPETEQSQFAIDATNKLNFVKQRLRKTLDPELNFRIVVQSKYFIVVLHRLIFERPLYDFL